MLEDVGQDHYIHGFGRAKILQSRSGDFKPGFSCDDSRVLIQLQALYVKSVPLVDNQAPSLIAADIQQIPFSFPRVERHVAIDEHPSTIQQGEKKDSAQDFI